MFEKYYGTSLYMKAPNGNDTRLDEPLWIAVRTPTFKKWFGDWEMLAIINEVENMPASAIRLHESLDKAGIKEVFKSFGEVENKRDGRVVVFPTKSAGKIHYHKGFNTGEVIRNFKSLFESAIPIISEKEILKEGHKVHGNVESYEHYINKFSANGNEYFIRFTVPVIRNNKGAGNVHSSAISEVSIYKNGDSTLTLIQTPGSSSPSFIDGKLWDFLNSVNKKDVSKVVDENGEPLVVYHGTQSNFYEFKHGKAIGSGDKFGYLGEAFYATNDESVAETYGDRVIPIFLNLKNPYTVDDPAFTSPHSAGSFAKSLNVSTDKVSDLLKSQGYDGVIAKDEGMDYIEYAVYNSNQIKSAYGNAEFNPNEGDIYREPSVGGADVANAANADNAEGGQISRGDSRYVAERFDASPRAEGWSKEEADKAFDDLWNALGGDGRLTADEMRKLEGKIDAFTKKIDPRMIELPEVLSSSVVPLAQDFVKAEGGGNVHVHAVGYSVRVHGDYHFLEETRFPVGGKSGFFAAHYNGAGGF